MSSRALSLLLLCALTACGAAKKAVKQTEKDLKATPDKVDQRGKDVKDTTKDGVEAEAEVDP